jgi:hypothetical protein
LDPKKKKMKRSIHKINIFLFSFALVLGSCSKNFIEKSPTTSIPASDALTTEGTLQNGLNGVYATLRSVGLYGRDIPICGDLQADNIWIEYPRNSGRYITQYSYTVVVDDQVPAEMWTAAYAGILRANQVIDAVITDPKANPQNIKIIKAQAYAIRALLYFKLVTYFAKPYTDDPNALGVPITLHYDPNATPGRDHVKDVYTQIVSDLKTAFQGADSYINSVTLSKYAIEGLLARVYLYMGDNTNAEAAAQDVIKNSEFTLVSPATYGALFANPAIKSDAIEVMFEVDADKTDNNGTDDLGAFYLHGYQDVYASRGLVALYSPTDCRQSVILQNQQTKGGAPATLVLKYPNGANADKDNIKVLRLAEVYLIAAEAAQAVDETTAKKYLNLLMAQRDPSIVYASTGAQLLNDIVQERRKELAFEGDRFYDLNRLKRVIARTSNVGSTSGPLTINYPDNRRVAPIPQVETQVNAVIAGQQNPGY